MKKKTFQPTPAQRERAYLRTLVTQFENAVRAHEMAGGGDPDDIPVKELRYKLARQRLLANLGA